MDMDENRKRSVRLHMRMLPSIKKLAEERARAENRTLSNYIEHLILKDASENGSSAATDDKTEEKENGEQ